LPDFSFAGYHRGESGLPDVPPGVSVQDFGATGDGTTDDSQAFLDALNQVESGAIEIPPGRYRITQPLEITRSRIVLRGAGSDGTTLFFPTPLNEIKPNWGATTSGQRTSNYSWSGGFITIRGSFQSRSLTEIAQPAARGDQSVTVASTENLRVGQEVEIYQTDRDDNSLAVHLYSGDPGPVHNLKGRTKTSLVCRITAIEGKRAHLDRPLRCDLRLMWRPQVRSFEPSVIESGIEGVTFAFPETPYEGHFTELGFNAIALRQAAHCWVRDIRTVNADSGLFVSGQFNTIDGVVLESQRRVDNQNCVGHHGISLSGGDNVVRRFDFRARYIHDITVSHHCAGNVCEAGRGVDLSLDHHRYAPYENLFTDIDAGEGRRLWKCGGGASLGKHCGARGTFWNIRAERPLSYPPPGFGPPSMNLIGLRTEEDSVREPDGRWFEAIPPEELVPANLREAQLKLRMSGRQ
jgi:hypothetical protein